MNICIHCYKRFEANTRITLYCRDCKKIAIRENHRRSVAKHPRKKDIGWRERMRGVDNSRREYRLSFEKRYGFAIPNPY